MFSHSSNSKFLLSLSTLVSTQCNSRPTNNLYKKKTTFTQSVASQSLSSLSLYLIIMMKPIHLQKSTTFLAPWPGIVYIVVVSELRVEKNTRITYKSERNIFRFLRCCSLTANKLFVHNIVWLNCFLLIISFCSWLASSISCYLSERQNDVLFLLT